MAQIIDFDSAGRKRREEQRKALEDDLIALLNEFRGLNPVCMDWVYHAQMLADGEDDSLYEAGKHLRAGIWRAIDELSAHLVNGDYDGDTVARYGAEFRRVEIELTEYIYDVREAREDR